MRRSLSVLLALALLVVAGCGSDSGGTTSKSDYKKDLAPVNKKLVALGNEVGSGVSGASGKTNSEIEDTFGGFADRLDSIRSDLDDLNPPSDIKDEQDKLVDAMAAVGKSLSGIEAAAKKGNANAARDATRDLIKSAAGLKTARAALLKAVQ
jgi:hypothetical protein